MKSRKARQRRFQYEPLESRQMMAVTPGLGDSLLAAAYVADVQQPNAPLNCAHCLPVTSSTGTAALGGQAVGAPEVVQATYSNGVLTITGTSGNDNLRFIQSNGWFGLPGGTIGWYSSSTVQSVVINLGSGDDHVSLDSLASGGQQALSSTYTINSGAGSESVRLANKNDVFFSDTGHQLIANPNGTTTLDGQVLSVIEKVKATFSNGVLTITGTSGNDDLRFIQSNGWFGLTGGAIGWYSSSTVNSIVINLGGGDDYVSLDSFANGGQQALNEKFTINSGAGNEKVHLANGNDVSFAGAGHQLVVNSNGTTTLDGQVVNVVEKVTASYSNGVLTITGTSGNDDLRFIQSNGWFGLTGGTIGWYSASTVTSVVINLGGGDDYVSLDSLANGGQQALSLKYTINSGAGNETVHLASGKNITFSGSGHQLIANSNGTTTLDGQVVDPTTPPPPPVTNWFDANIADAALRALGHNLYLDNLIDRADMIALFRDTEDGGVVDATELADLRSIVAANSLFGSLDYVDALATCIANGSVANAKYLGQTLGNLAAGSTMAHMENLINKWFLGLDRPTTSGTYRQTSGTLFVNGATYGDIRQGYLGDCYFVASLGEVAIKNAAIINNMFIVNGDGTYTVKFFTGGQAKYVTVDSYLPTDGAGRLLYANVGAMYNDAGNELWTSLAEKAYVQINEMGWVRPGLPGSGQNAYSAIAGGYIYAALGHITGQATTPFASMAGAASFNTFVTAFNQGKFIGFASKSVPLSGSVVGNHAYAVVGYNATNQTVTLFNPWGTAYGLVTMSWAELQGSFSYFDRTT